MPIDRRWARELEDPGSPLAQYERVRAAARVVAAPEPIDLAEFVRATLNAAIGDATVTTQLEARAAIETALAGRVRRPLSISERTKVFMLVALEWERREPAQLERQRAAARTEAASATLVCYDCHFQLRTPAERAEGFCRRCAAERAADATRVEEDRRARGEWLSDFQAGERGVA